MGLLVLLNCMLIFFLFIEWGFYLDLDNNSLTILLVFLSSFFIGELFVYNLDGDCIGLLLDWWGGEFVCGEVILVCGEVYELILLYGEVYGLMLFCGEVYELILFCGEV